jgi:Ala-tRNA(Pro) deacylase
MSGPADACLALLERLHIAYTETRHAPAYHMSDLPPIEDALGAPFFRNVFLQNRQGTAFYLLLIRGDKAFRTAEVSRGLGVARLSFGGEEALLRLLRCTAGAVNPLGLVFDLGGAVQLVIDRQLRDIPRLCLHPCDNTRSVALGGGDLFDTVLPATGHSAIWLDITGEAPTA